MYFQRFFLWVLWFRAYGTPCLYFCGISNWGNFRSMFWRRHKALRKLLIWIKLVFTAIVPICLQSFSLWFILFKAYDARCWYFFNIKLEQLQIKVLKQWHDLSKTVTFLKKKIHFHRLNKFLTVLWMCYSL